MYTILVTDSHELVTTRQERIMKRSKLINRLHFLTNPTFEGIDMSEFTVCLEYKLPVSGNYVSEILEQSEELFRKKLEYVLPIDTNLTSEAGDVEIQLTFTRIEINEDGSNTQIVRKTSPATIRIYPIATWSDIIPDEALSAIDQRLLKADAILDAFDQLDTDGFDDLLQDLSVEDNKIAGVRLDGSKTTEFDIVTPKINDGEYDGDYDGILELDDDDGNGNP